MSVEQTELIDRYREAQQRDRDTLHQYEVDLQILRNALVAITELGDGASAVIDAKRIAQAAVDKVNP